MATRTNVTVQRKAAPAALVPASGAVAPANDVAGFTRAPCAIEIRWSASVAAGASSIVSDGGDGGGKRARLHAFVVRLRLAAPGGASLEAWTEVGPRKRAVLRRVAVELRALEEGDIRHLDAFLDGRRLLAITLAPNLAKPLYARTPLLAEAGFAPGGFDPPAVRVVDAAYVAARRRAG